MRSATMIIDEWQPHLQSLLDACGIEAKLRRESPDDWLAVGHRLAYFPVVYSNAMVDYQIAYWHGNAGPVEDVSLIIVHDNRQCGIWPLSIARAADGLRLGSNGAILIPPLFAKGTATKTIKAITKACLEFVDRFAVWSGRLTWESLEEYSGRFPMSEWHDQSLRAGGVSRLDHTMYVDLSLELPEIKSRFRKSFKSLITTGYKLWSVAVLNSADPQVWEDFRTLHRLAAGRTTRSDQSWQLQYQSILDGDGFLVYLRNSEGKMVGGAFFNLTRDEGYYSVGAYERALFDKPIGHVIQYHAISEMQRLGLRWYRIGSRPYTKTLPAPTAKQMSIADFKQGFSTDLFPAYRVHHQHPAA